MPRTTFRPPRTVASRAEASPRDAGPFNPGAFDFHQYGAAAPPPGRSSAHPEGEASDLAAQIAAHPSLRVALSQSMRFVLAEAVDDAGESGGEVLDIDNGFLTRANETVTRGFLSSVLSEFKAQMESVKNEIKNEMSQEIRRVANAVELNATARGAANASPSDASSDGARLGKRGREEVTLRTLNKRAVRSHSTATPSPCHLPTTHHCETHMLSMPTCLLTEDAPAQRRARRG
jgi:hypothetical protein